ncbi:MAG TPA: VCBS repeat-containing protein [Chitinophagaceae bacterium]|nr:VCBS repeat-containing protein [Chitinophagaceae bacterium]
MKNSVHKLFLLIVFFSALTSCNRKAEDRPLFELMQQTGVDFINKVEDRKDDNSFYFRNFYNGGGVALGDINNDGFADIFLTSNTADNKLYLNQKNWKFTDISAGSGMNQDSMWSTGAVMTDVNADGWLDIYVCNSGNMRTGNRRNKLYINNKDLTFTESAKQYGLDVSGYTTQVSFFDYDIDGDLDCFMINNSPIPFSSLNFSGMRDRPEKDWSIDQKYKGGGNHLFRNDNGHYSEVTEQAGIHTSMISYGLGVSVGDINNDGYPDVYVGNDFIERDYMYINQKNGTFKDELEDKIEHISMSSMSTDLADINNDGHLEIFTTDMFPETDYRLKTMGTFDNVDLYRSKQKAGFYHQFVKNCLQLNNGNGHFSDIANFSGVDATDWSWAGLLFDMDNDGFNDIFVCNGVNRDVGNLDFLDFFSNDVYRKMQETGQTGDVNELLKNIPINPQQNKCYRNDGDLQFTDVSTSWGFSQTSFSNGAAYADLDNDGDLDLVINNENLNAFVYQNHSRDISGNNYLAVELKGAGGNAFAIGSKIKIFKGTQVFYREVIPSRGFQSSVDFRNVIGIGKNTNVDSMIIVWPDNTSSKFISPAINKHYVIDQSREKRQSTSPQLLNSPTPLFEEVATSFDKHVEDDYVDFYFERNIPEMLSREGPKAAVGDVNGDGTDDVYIGGAVGQPGQLYLQDATGKFLRSEQKAFNEFSDFEDVAILFFDVDADKDLDLFIGAGGNNVSGISRQLQHRLYLNDGKGNFSINVNAFGANESNISVAVTGDFDSDGDPDLFVGGRSTPQLYGATPLSYVYLNDGKGKFKEVQMRVGMITGAVWSDKQLIVVGEWMGPKIFQWKEGRMGEVKNDLQNLNGWWQTVAASDLNSDGRTDLMLGNIGDNFYLTPTKEQPVKIWINDFDQNGTLDKILTRTIDGKDMPVFLKQDMQEQLPIIKKQNLRHGDYATKTIQDLFKPELLAKAVVHEFNYSSSIIAWNEGEGKYRIQKLPNLLQLSSMNAILFTDLNGDGRTDIVSGGNKFGFPPQFGRLDASYGDVLLNDGNGNFSRSNNSGLLIKGQVRDIKSLRVQGEQQLLFLRNDDRPVIYRIKRHAQR